MSCFKTQHATSISTAPCTCAARNCVERPFVFIYVLCCGSFHPMWSTIFFAHTVRWGLKELKDLHCVHITDFMAREAGIAGAWLASQQQQQLPWFAQGCIKAQQFRTLGLVSVTFYVRGTHAQNWFVSGDIWIQWSVWSGIPPAGVLLA